MSSEGSEGSEGEVVYLIEGVIEFHPRDNSLISMKTGERKTLLAAASSCLHLLFQHQGNLVTKKALFEAGWEGGGLYVTDNTFYQNILILRRSFIALGFEKTLIITLTRKGLMIPADVNIKLLSECSENSVAEVAQIDSSIKSEASVNDKLQMMGRISTIPLVFFRKLACLLVVIGISVAGVHDIFFASVEKNYFAEYKLLGKIDECIIFINNQQDNATDYVRFTENNPLRCSDKKYIYLTLIPFMRRVSVIRCLKPLLNQPTMQCVSDYYLEKDEVLQ